MPEKENAFIAVAYGDGIVNTLKEIGVDYIIEGGQTMNPSTDDILSSIEKVNAKNIYVFPNNKNIILAAEQAKELSDKNVIVIPTKSIPQSISAVLAFAFAPHSKNTMGFSRSLRCLITLSVKISQPQFLWLFGLDSRTVRTVFNKSTPCFAHFVNSPWEGIESPNSAFSSLYMCFNDGGGSTPFCTEKQSPCA